MATIVLSTVGQLFGGPIGSTVGALVGRQIDGMIFRGPRNHGPRLKELAVSTSSYGQPIAAIHGCVRAPGTVVWASELVEHSETHGGKGKPQTTEYSYSVSLAVVVSSRPIDTIGRIWADGNLLRGAAGDLKTAGTMRIHTGRGDQACDPLIEAALGPHCPGFRGCAYVVFEDLALADFGNRIPALSFEIIAGSGRDVIDSVAAAGGFASDGTGFAEIDGFIHEGGDTASVLALFDRLKPLAAVTRDNQPTIVAQSGEAAQVLDLPEPAAWEDGEFGARDGRAHARRTTGERALAALRYYDPDRDFQPGLQRVENDSAGSRSETLEFPGVFAAASARTLLEQASVRDRVHDETLAWRMAELDPRIGPGSIVRAAGVAGLWQVSGWEWRDGGIELELTRHFAQALPVSPADPGQAWAGADRLPAPTSLRVFELPPEAVEAASASRRFAALSTPAGRWAGATIYVDSAGTLVPVATAGPRRAVGGRLIAPLGSGAGLRFVHSASLEILLDDTEAVLATASLAGLANGANRLLVGTEIIQFCTAQPLGEGRWRLTGLLRGRGGTEPEALAGHGGGTPVTLLDTNLVELPPGPADSADTFAALGLADDEPVYASIENSGCSRRPLLPVHARVSRSSGGGLDLAWTRRARGGWNWPAEVEQPLVEQSELYEIGIGDVDRPFALWAAHGPQFLLDAATTAALVAAHPDAALWVRQQGTYAKSPPLALAATIAAAASL